VKKELFIKALQSLSPGTILRIKYHGWPKGINRDCGIELVASYMGTQEKLDGSPAKLCLNNKDLSYKSVRAIEVISTELTLREYLKQKKSPDIEN
jgi:hypothetical protein